MKIAIGCDEAAYAFKEVIRQHLEEKEITVDDVGVYDTNPVLYPDKAAEVCKKILAGEADAGILICGTGIGMSITANKFEGIRAAVCHDLYSTERSKKSNDCQVMCMGARVIGVELAKRLVDIWLDSDFDGGRSQPKVDRISFYEKNQK